MPDINSVNAEQGMSVESQSNESLDTNINTPAMDTGVSENNSVAAEQKPAQDKDTNTAFAEMRRAREAEEARANQAEARANQIEKDSNYSYKYQDLGIRTEAELRQAYGHQGINTWEDVDRHYEAQQKNIDPEFYKKFTDMESKLNAYESEKQMKQHDEKLSNDPQYGELYKTLKDDSHAMSQKFNCDLRTGFTLALEAKAPELFKKPDIETIKQDAIKEYIQKVKQGNAPIESSGSGGTIVTSTPKSWKEAREGMQAVLSAGKFFT